jgi:hypothetical protein
MSRNRFTFPQTFGVSSLNRREPGDDGWKPSPPSLPPSPPLPPFDLSRWFRQIGDADELFRSGKPSVHFGESNPLLCCAMCGRPTKPREPGEAMVTWWLVGSIVRACALTHGARIHEGACQGVARSMGTVRQYAACIVGVEGLYHLVDIAYQHPHWTPAALRRWILLVGAIHGMQGSEREKSR